MGDAGTDPLFLWVLGHSGEDAFHFGLGHLSKVVDVTLAIRAVTSTLVADHLVPIVGTRLCDFCLVFHLDHPIVERVDASVERKFFRPSAAPFGVKDAVFDLLPHSNAPSV